MKKKRTAEFLRVEVINVFTKQNQLDMSITGAEGFLSGMITQKCC